MSSIEHRHHGAGNRLCQATVVALWPKAVPLGLVRNLPGARDLENALPELTGIPAGPVAGTLDVPDQPAPKAAPGIEPETAPGGF